MQLTYSENSGACNYLFVIRKLLDTQLQTPAIFYVTIYETVLCVTHLQADSYSLRKRNEQENCDAGVFVAFFALKCYKFALLLGGK